MLAYGRRAPGASSIRVVGVSRDGALVAPRATIKLPFSFRTACPKWSTDGSRVAYLGRSGKVVVHGLDGSIQQPKPGDPVVRDFSRDVSALVSPTGDLIARRPGNGCDVVVSRRDGSRRRVVDDFPCGYAIAGWSPGARKLLVMKDMDGQHFALIAFSVNAPFTATPIVVGVRVNNPRSWPGYGDVSWQHVLR
jgi:hypothetical protein